MINIIMTNIKALCAADDVSLKELASHCGVGARYFLNPRNDMGVEMLVRVADFFEVHPSKLMYPEFAEEVRKDSLQRQIEELQSELEECNKKGIIGIR